jgi:peroxiredoxin
MRAKAAKETAPDFELPTTGGQKMSLKDGLARGPVLAAFFKASCPTCHFTFPFLERLYQQLRNAGVQIWGISQDNARDSRFFAEEFGVTFPLLIDEKPYEVSKKYGLEYTPTLFLIAPDGHLEITADGFSKRDLLEIQKRLARHYSATPPPLFLPHEKVPEYKPG